MQSLPKYTSSHRKTIKIFHNVTVYHNPTQLYPNCASHSSNYNAGHSSSHRLNTLSRYSLDIWPKPRHDYRPASLDLRELHHTPNTSVQIGQKTNVRIYIYTNGAQLQLKRTTLPICPRTSNTGAKISRHMPRTFPAKISSFTPCLNFQPTRQINAASRVRGLTLWRVKSL